ncbi:YhdP family protein [Halothiobacillus sp. DCM-1]|uniref:YhdP family protein n=1 Tax=Halothiobacillus sp. DCM-1 TaxID=3112558 RepID=UPI00324E9329
MHLPPIPTVIHRSSRPLRRLLRWGLVLLASALVLLALLFSALRLALPYLNDHRAELAAWLSQAWGAPVAFAQIDVRLAGYQPQLILTDVQLGHTGPRIQSLGVSLALWRSVMNARPMIGTLVLDAPSLQLAQQANGHWQLVGAPTASEPTSWDLAALRTHLPDLGSISLNQARIELSNAAHTVTHSLELTAQARLGGHGWALSGTLSIPSFGATPVAVRAQGRLDAPLESDVFVSAHDWSLPAVQKSLRDFGGADLRQSLGGCAAQVEGMDCAEGMPLIDRGQFTGEVWLHFLGNQLARTQALFDIKALQASRMARIAGVSAISEPQARASVDAIRGRLAWGYIRDGWRLDVDQLQVQVNPQEALPSQSVHLIHRRENTWFSADYADLKQLSVWLATAPLPAHYLKLLGDNALTGQAEQVRLHFSGNTLASGALRLRHFGNVPGQKSWPVVGGADGQGGMNLALFKQPAGWIAQLDESHLVLALPQQWREPLAITAVNGTVYWAEPPAGAQDAPPVLFSPSLTLSSPDLHFQGQFRYAPATANSAPALDVLGQFSQIAVARIPAFLPRREMGKEALDWLDRALPGAHQTGEVTQGSLEFHGDPSRFPFERGGGFLSVNFDFANLHLPFQPGWPSLDAAAGHIAFINQQFHAALTAGTLAGVPVAGGRVSLFDLNRPMLNLAVRTTAPLPDLLRFLHATPLLGNSNALQSLQTTGKAALSVDGDIGLEARLPTTIQGRLTLQNNGLAIADSGLRLTDLSGVLQFSNTRISGHALSGQVNGAPVQWSVETGGKSPQEVTRIHVHGALDPLFYLRSLAVGANGWAAKVTGKSQVTATVELPHQGHDFSIDAQTDLLGVTSELPVPLTKAPDTTWPIRVSLGFVSGKLAQLDLTSSAQLGWQAHLRFGAGRTLTGSAGNSVSPNPLSGLDLSIATPVLDWDAWQPVLMAGSSTASPDNGIPFHLQLHCADFKAAGTTLGATDISVQFNDARYRVKFAGAALQGDLEYQPAAAGERATVKAQFARLYLPKVADTEHSAGSLSPPAPPQSWNLSRLPVGQIEIKDLRRGDQRWGALAFSMVSDAQGWHLNPIQWQPTDGVQLDGRAVVRGSGEQQRTVLTLSGQGDALGQALKQLYGNSPITGGKIERLHLDLDWPGSPDSFALARLNGAGSLRLKAGQVNDIDPGAGRLAGLFSLSALTKRLQLDFSDIFDRGLRFDELNADWTIQQGLLTLAPLEVKNASLHLNIQGDSNLADDSLKYQVKVYSDVGMLLPIIGTVAGGPLVGGAVLAVQQALKSIDKNPSPTMVYEVTGTLSKPVIQRLSAVPTPTP